MKWKQRIAKLISVFFMGYAGGFAASLPIHVTTLDEINWILIFIWPTLGGLVLIFPQISKIFGDIANENKK